MSDLDPRQNAFRIDLADEALRGKVESARFTKGEMRQIICPVASVLKTPASDSPQTTQALFGEMCTVFEERDGFAWVQLQQDHYVGYVASAALSAEIFQPTHRVSTSSTLLYPVADLKSHPVKFLPMNAQVQVAGNSGNFAHLSSGGYIFASHLASRNEVAPDFVSVARNFLDVPYYWGGKTTQGIDCSGLVQISLQASGKIAPRDSDLQEKSLGTPVNHFKNFLRGDLIFWPGHVGIMHSATQLLHANGHFMKVVCEPLQDTVERAGSPIRSVRRLSEYHHIPAAK